MAPTLPEETSRRSLTLPLLIILILISAGGGYYYIKSTYPSLFKYTFETLKTTIIKSPSPVVDTTTNNPEPTPTPNIPKPSVKLPSGPQTYTFSHGELVKGPRISTITFTPLTPDPNSTQSVSLNATYQSDITKVIVEIITDNKSTRHELTRSTGSKNDGTWTGNWTIDDTYENRYGARLVLESSPDTYDNIMWFK